MGGGGGGGGGYKGAGGQRMKIENHSNLFIMALPTALCLQSVI